ncbi:two-component system C4-dicarboxylate transport sensor histidine kinase DctB [Bradyrhizobium huanghuaihaiense]|uniref:histidine kinase n=1 Tax=Bradyrhizobium huanghuaihaiense TaxID=990078 RepID=A0A562R3M3_9BRAD|nr:ATP-binding protein [Bradyrhizobium huanghuaihaiense]TWI63164.1 two-component system C4-dicarboxylate transport sensor histidine kinase DctB [Bradyrhizobium huanghuaihaiense]
MQRPRPALPRYVLIGMAALAAIAAAGWLAYVLALDAAFARMEREANDRLALIASTFDATVARYRYLPAVLSLADPIRELYRDPHDASATAAANRYLKSLNQGARSAELYVLDSTGLALAASNFDLDSSFVGHNYGFRAYFMDAMRTGEGHYYAVGATTGQPGYFLSHRIMEGGKTLGVAVVKIDLSALEADWASAGDLVAMEDENGVIFLASREDWKYRPLLPIPAQRLAELNAAQQFGQAIDPAPVFVPKGDRERVQIGRARGRGNVELGDYALQVRPHDQGWRLLLFSDVADARRNASTVAIASVFALIASLLVVLVAYQRRQVVRAKLDAHDVLERRVAERTEELRRTMESLVQSAKLASLGQALAGVAHEINQPLAALITYVASSRVLLRRNEVDRAAANLDLMSSIAERMMALIDHLRMFARKETGTRSAVALAPVIDNAIRLLQYRIDNEHIEVVRSAPAEPLHGLANPIRLEQVVVNLLSNAIDAMRDRERRVLGVTLDRHDDSAVIEVSDTGAGIAPEHIKSLFDPFFTTKEIGEGLGLGLSISYGIVREFGGDILVDSTPGRGSTFKVVIPVMDVALASPHQELHA